MNLSYNFIQVQGGRDEKRSVLGVREYCNLLESLVLTSLSNHWILSLSFRFLKARSSVVEQHLDVVKVGGSIPLVPTELTL